MALRTYKIYIYGSDPTNWVEENGNAIKLVAGQAIRLDFGGADDPPGPDEAFTNINDFRLEIKLAGATSGEAAFSVLAPTEKTDTAVIFDLTQEETNLPYQGLRLVILAQEVEGGDFVPYSWRDVPLLHDGQHSGPPGALPSPRLASSVDGGALIVWTDNDGTLRSVQLNDLSTTYFQMRDLVLDSSALLDDATEALEEGVARQNHPGFVQEYYGTTLLEGWLWCDGSAVSRTTYADLFAAIGTSCGDGDGSTTFNVPDKRGRGGIGRDDMGGVSAGRLGITVTGNVADESDEITGLSSIAGITVGMRVFGAGIPAGATVVSIDSGTALTISADATATGSGIALRFGLVDGLSVGSAGGSHVHTLTEQEMPNHDHGVPTRGRDVPNSGGSPLGYAGVWPMTIQTDSAGGSQAHPNLQPSIVCNFIIKT